MEKSSALSLNLPADVVKHSISSMPVRHFDEKTIDQLIWPETEEKSYSKTILLSLIKNGTKHYIDNIEARVNVLTIDSYVIPIVIVDEQYENSFVCSPYGHYISYALECTDRIFKQKFLRLIVNAFVKCLGVSLRLGKVNKIIYVNNWLFPTDLHHKNIKQEHVEAITSHIAQHFPDYAIAFKSINDSTHLLLSQALESSRYDSIVTREVFLTDTKKEEIFQTRIFKSDLKLLKESSNSFTVVDKSELNQADLEKILQLYKHLYVEKYSKLNPQHNQNFLDLVYKSDLIQIKAIKKNQEIEGFFGYFIRDGIMTAPLFGYDEKPSANKNLYRLLSTLLTLEAKEKGCLLHQSAGASFYKKVRRAESHMESMAVYTKHLSFFRQLPWKCLKFIMNSASRLFTKY